MNQSGRRWFRAFDRQTVAMPPARFRRRRSITMLAVIAAATVAMVGAVTVAPTTAVAATGYTALDAPQRILDTRSGEATADGKFAGTGLRGAGSTLELPVAGRVGVPGDPAAVVLNVTVTGPQAAGYVTVFPCGQSVPTASNLNFGPGQTVPNAVVAAIGDGGKVCLYTLARTHLIVDVAGSFPSGAYAPLPKPGRLVDTRPGEATVDGQSAGQGFRSDGSVTKFVVADRAGVGANAAAVVLNVTATATAAPGYVTVYPCDQAVPTASNLNFGPGQTVPNQVISRVAPDGTVCAFTRGGAHLVVDVSGSLPGATFKALGAPQRLLDTRHGADIETADGAFRSTGTQAGRFTLQLDTAGRVGIPADASAVVLNVTAVGPAAPGYITAHPRGSKRPNASNVNYASGDVVANSVVARVGAGGEVCLFTSAATELVVDVAGWLTGPAPAASGAPCPSVSPNEGNARDQLLLRPALHSGRGVDRIGVIVCDIPDPAVTLDEKQLAAWANAEVAPWFVEASNGAYRPEFSAIGRVSRSNSAGCRDASAAAGDPFTNVVIVDTSGYGGGVGGPGQIWSDRDTNLFAASPAATRRSAWIGGGAAMIDPTVFVHEIGHTLHWPHSFIGPDNYDNPLDVMSGQPYGDEFSQAIYDLMCERADGGGRSWCLPQNTVAFNRLASDWMAGTQVGIHRSGMANYTLDRPHGGGVQMVALPTPGAPHDLMTIEARPTTGRDEHLGKGGVAVHLIDQENTFSGISASRRQRQANGESGSFGHVIDVGKTVTWHGVTISVLAAAGGGYVVSVSGTYRPPADGLG